MECHKGFERCSFEFHLPSSCVSPTLTREHSPSKMAWPAKRFPWRSWQRDATLERRRTKSLGEYSEGRKVFLQTSWYTYCTCILHIILATTSRKIIALINSYTSPKMALKFSTSLFPGGISLNFERTSKWFVLWRRARWCGDPTLDPEGLGNRGLHRTLQRALLVWGGSQPGSKKKHGLPTPLVVLKHGWHCLVLGNISWTYTPPEIKHRHPPKNIYIWSRRYIFHAKAHHFCTIPFVKIFGCQGQPTPPLQNPPWEVRRVQ